MRVKYTPRPYGAMIAEHMLSVPRNAVWAGMGLGKTVCALTAVDAKILAGYGRPTLVVAPLRVARDTWLEESRKWSHLSQVSVMPIVGTLAERRAALRYDASVYTTNYENLVWLVEQYGDVWPFEHVIADESTKLKGFRLRQGGKRARALGRVAHTKIKNFTELTGTPASNGLIDLWGQIWMLDGGQRLGRTFQAYKDRWFTASYDGYGVVPREGAQEEIQERLKDICLTVDAKDWFDLREPIVTNTYIDLPPKARRLYDDMEDKFFMSLAGHDIEVFNAAAKTQKLLQLASGAVYLDPAVNEDGSPLARQWREAHDIKLQVLDDIVEEANGAPVLVSYNFRSDLARIKELFPGCCDLATKEGMLAFKTGRFRVGAGHPQSIGHGVDGLQNVCNIMVNFSQDWNLESRLQFLERIGPMRQFQAGYTRPVFVYNILARDTIDELVMERVESKRSVQDILLAAMKLRGK